MKVIKADRDRLTFSVTRGQKELLRRVLAMYPVVPPAHHQLSRGSNRPSASDQRLLDEAIAEQRKLHRTQLDHLFAESGLFRKGAVGFEFTLSREQLEMFLQVLNDVRVGIWVKLGEPEDIDELRDATPLNPDALVMEVAAAFQFEFLTAVSRHLPSPE